MTPPRAAWRVRRPTPKPLPPSLDGLLEEDVDAIPVRVTIVQDGVTTGWDDGALGFEDDAVWFSGRATSFRLAAPDILPGAYLLSRREAVTDGEALFQGLPLRHPTREVWVRVEVLTVGEGRPEDVRRLVGNVKRLRARTKGGGESEYPPLTPRPGVLLLDPPTSTEVNLRLWGMFMITFSLLLRSCSVVASALMMLSGVAMVVWAWFRYERERRRRAEEAEA